MSPFFFNRLAKPEEKRSRIILADGEFPGFQANDRDAKLCGEAPVAIKLRELQTLAEIAREKNLIVITQAGEVGTGAVASLTGAPKEVTKREQ
jgi:hypothetical protein